MVTPNFGGYTEVLVIPKREGQSDVDLSQAWSPIEYENGLPQNVTIILNKRPGRCMITHPVPSKFDNIFARMTDARDNVIEDTIHNRKIKQ